MMGSIPRPMLSCFGTRHESRLRNRSSFRNRTAASLIALIALAGAGCTGISWGHRTHNATDDASITSEVKSQLALDRASALTRINVETKDGIVYLNGTVKEQRERDRADTLASHVNGVRHVVNNVRVEPHTSPAGPAQQSKSDSGR